MPQVFNPKTGKFEGTTWEEDQNAAYVDSLPVLANPPAPKMAPGSVDTAPDEVTADDLTKAEKPIAASDSNMIALQARRYKTGADAEAADKALGMTSPVRSAFTPDNDNPAPGAAGKPGSAAPVVPGADPLAALNDAVAPRPGAAQAALDASKKIGPDIQTQRQVQTAGEKKAVAEAQRVNEAQQELAAKARGEAINQAIEVHNQDEIDRLAAVKAEQEAAARQQKADDDYKKADSYLTQKRAEFEKTSKVTDLFAGKEGAAASAALWTGIGAFGAALTGGPNQALQIIENAAERHRLNELERIRNDKELLGMAREDRQMALNRADIELRNRQAASKEVLAKERAARLSMGGANKAEIDGDAIILGLRESAAKDLVANERSLRTIVTTSNANQNQLKIAALMAAQPSSDKGIEKADHSERQADHFTNIGALAYRQLKASKGYDDHDLAILRKYDAMVDETLRSTPIEKLNAAFAAVGGTVAAKLHNKARFAAETTFVNSTLRPESGAAIGPSEFVKRSIETRASASASPQEMSQKDQTMLGYLAGNAIQSYRPGYWNQRLHQIGGDVGRMSNAEIATLYKEVKTGGPRAAEALQILKAARGIQ